MTARIERAPLPDPAQLRRALAARAESLHAGARPADTDVQGPTGVDMLLVDEDGRPILVDIIAGNAGAVPTRIFEHTEWYEKNRRLFLRAYSGEGVVRIEEPVFVFLAQRFTASVTAAVSAMHGITVRLVRAESFLIDGAPEFLLEDVTPSQGPRPASSAPRPISTARRQSGEVSPSQPRPEEPGSGETEAKEIIESAKVRDLLALFRSGVDGLDARISAVESNDRISFQVGQQKLADVRLSPASFTVSAGDGSMNPMVVSDRVSLERALNLVVSLYVREDRQRGGNGQGEVGGLTGDERGVLAEIWEGGGQDGS